MAIAPRHRDRDKSSLELEALLLAWDLAARLVFCEQVIGDGCRSTGVY